VNEKQGTVYIPKEIRVEMKWDWEAIHRGSVLFVFPEGTSKEVVVNSLLILLEAYHFEGEIRRKKKHV